MSWPAISGSRLVLPERPVVTAYVTLPDGRRFHACGCMDVPDGRTSWRPFLLCADHQGGRP